MNPSADPRNGPALLGFEDGDGFGREADMAGDGAFGLDGFEVIALVEQAGNGDLERGHRLGPVAPAVMLEDDRARDRFWRRSSDDPQGGDRTVCGPGLRLTGPGCV
jgi:hypothetical protein